MPVYRESLEKVLTPLDRVPPARDADVRAPRRGPASIFVNDDGLQLLPQADRGRAHRVLRGAWRRVDRAAEARQTAREGSRGGAGSRRRRI